MFSLPIPLKSQPEEKAGQGSFTVEGEVDEYPIMFPETTVEEFDHFVENCLYFTLTLLLSWTPPPVSVQVHVDVLKFAHKFDLREDVKNSVIFKLSEYREPHLKAVDRLNLARLYEIPSFIRPVFVSFCRITLKISDLPYIDIQKIGLPAFSVLAKVKEAINEERQMIAYHAPSVDSLPISDECNDLTHSTVCLRVWRKEWWSKIGRGILQPVPIFALDFPDDVVEAVQKLQLPGVTPACRHTFISFVASHAHALTRPSQLIDDGVQELERLLSVGAL
ncbi:hypothetical protein K443DRAFT_126358 [Laccaria amethystina LaAM-08-1]|uniref:Uncharacterized protein n=1 Tax=Laccaria amethystina LaAM-08-1 TaxID=1095629 RepID=A0A0C9X090_9AGAR|nr:hypothetical protein K443DRAFT_126358 [Laccaria amethystina LaAM-08-1]